MNRRLYAGFLLLLLAVVGGLLFHGGPVAPVDPVRLVWPNTPIPPPPVELRSVRTMNETAFFKVLGVLHNRGVEPVGPVVVRGRFASRHDGSETSAMSMTMPEVIVPGAAVRFELVVPERPETSRVEIDFRLLSGAPLPVDGARGMDDEAGAP